MYGVCQADGVPVDLLVVVNIPAGGITVGISGGLSSPNVVCLTDDADAFVEMALVTDFPSSQLPGARCIRSVG